MHDASRLPTATGFAALLLLGGACTPALLEPTGIRTSGEAWIQEGDPSLIHAWLTIRNHGPDSVTVVNGTEGSRCEISFELYRPEAAPPPQGDDQPVWNSISTAGICIDLLSIRTTTLAPSDSLHLTQSLEMSWFFQPGHDPTAPGEYRLIGWVRRGTTGERIPRVDYGIFRFEP